MDTDLDIDIFNLVDTLNQIKLKQRKLIQERNEFIDFIYNTYVEDDKYKDQVQRIFMATAEAEKKYKPEFDKIEEEKVKCKEIIDEYETKYNFFK